MTADPGPGPGITDARRCPGPVPRSAAGLAAPSPGRSGPIPGPVALALIGVLGLPLATVSALAQELPAATVSESAVRRFEIPAGTLDQALGRFGRQAGVAVIVNAELTSGLDSPGVIGDLPPMEALRRLLAGSGLEAGRNNAGEYVLRRLPSSRSTLGPDRVAALPTTLPTVRVEASSLRDPVTENSGTYLTRSTSTAARLDLTPRETPQTVSVVTRQEMDDFALTSINQAIDTVSGVFVYEEGGNGTLFYSRGFPMEAQYDGVSNPVGIGNSNRNPRLDTAFYDRIEILQGPAGLLSGAGDPGGVVNLVRKRPTAGFQGQAELQLGSWQQRRAVVDVSSPLVESGRLRARVVGLVDNADSAVDYGLRYRRGLYGVVEADLTATTTVHASYLYQRDRQRVHLGVPFAADGSDIGLDPSSYFGSAKGMLYKGLTVQTAGIEQRLPGDWRLTASVSHGVTRLRDYHSSWLYGDLDRVTGDGLALYQSLGLMREARFDAVDASVTGPVTAFGRRHDVVVGLNGTRMRDAHQGAGYVPTDINVYGFDPTTLPDPVPGQAYSGNARTRQHGLFGVARLNLADSLKLIVGSRVSWYDYRNDTGAEGQRESGVVSPYAGLVHDLGRQYSVYASYADIFKSQSQLARDGRPIDPIVGANLELGIKGELLDRRLNVSAAVFQLDQTNLARTDDSVTADPANLCAGQCYLAADKVRSRGVDLSLGGELRPGWHLMSGYTFVAGKYASGEQKGEHYMSKLPRHSFRLATFHQFRDSAWGAGASLRVFGQLSNDTGDVVIRRGGLALVGLSTRYRFTPKTDLTVTVDNLFDRRYYATVDSLFYTPLGEPRRLAATLRHRF